MENITCSDRDYKKRARNEKINRKTKNINTKFPKTK